MYVAVKFLGDCVGNITVRKKFQFCLLRGLFGGGPYALKVRFGHGVRNEHRIDAVQIEAPNVGSDVRFCGLLRRRSLRLFSAGFTVKRKRPSGEIIITSINLTRTEVRAIKKDL
jgi:hypothetical protein